LILVHNLVVQSRKTDGGDDMTGMVEEEIILAVEGRVGVLTMNRPHRLNALTPRLAEGLRGRLSDLIRDDRVGAIVLTGAGRGFCSGHDLKNAVAGGEPGVDRLLRDCYNPLIQLIRKHPKPIVGAVNGVAAGAGASLALACDIVIAARSATFVQAFVNIGIVPDAGSSHMLTRMIGAARARALALTGEALPASRAAEWGLILEAVSDGEELQRAKAIAEELAAKPPLGLAFTKRLMSAAECSTLEEQADMEADFQTIASASADHQEAIRAFVEKRPPAPWTGR
jgi:2-(1,2-epoxy-1,2-dihydrophenyl)acetyl-CoA isomerase